MTVFLDTGLGLALGLVFVWREAIRGREQAISDLLGEMIDETSEAVWKVGRGTLKLLGGASATIPGVGPIAGSIAGAVGGAVWGIVRDKDGRVYVATASNLDGHNRYL